MEHCVTQRDEWQLVSGATGEKGAYDWSAIWTLYTQTEGEAREARHEGQ